MTTTSMQHRGGASEAPAGGGTREPVPGPEPAYRLFVRALGVWLLLLVAAFFNGAFRNYALVPLAGEGVAEAAAVAVLAAVIGFAAWWLVATSRGRHGVRTWLGVGALWAGLTAAFEFGFFHFVLGVPWSVLLASYDPREGGYFALILLTSLLAPPVLAALRGPAAEN